MEKKDRDREREGDGVKETHRDREREKKRDTHRKERQREKKRKMAALYKCFLARKASPRGRKEGRDKRRKGREYAAGGISGQIQVGQSRRGAGDLLWCSSVRGLPD